MENEKMYLIHEDDYIKHIDEKLELYAMLRQLIFHLRRIPDTSAATRRVHEMANTYDIIIDELFDTWGIPGSYMVTGDQNELCDLMENELIEPEDAGYYTDDDGCISEVYDYEDDEYDTDKIRELLGISNSILQAVQRLNDIIEDEFDYAE